MALSIPIDVTEKADLKALVDSLVSQGLSLAEGLIAATRKIYRDLKPGDLGLSSANWTFNVTTGENTIVDYDVPDDTLIIIYGVYNLSTDPQVVEVIFGDKSKTVEDYYIEDMYLFDHPMKIFKRAIIFQPNSTAVIKAIAKGANSDERLGFLGIVIERAGKTVA